MLNMFRDVTQLLNSSINYNIKYRCYVDSLFSVHPKLGVGELTSSMLLLHSRYFYLVFCICWFFWGWWSNFQWCQVYSDLYI